MNTKFDPSIRAAFDSTKGIAALEFDDDVIQSAQAEREARIGRLERGESTFAQEEARLLQQWDKLKYKPNGAV